MTSPTSVLRISTDDGIELVADAYGEADRPPVVLLHGGGQTRHSWDASARRYGESGRYALTVDLRGHGDSGWSPTGVYDIDRFAADVRCVVEFLGRPAALIGASLGGVSSLMAVGTSDDDLATALVLVDVAPNIEPAGVSRIRTFMMSGLDGFATLDDAADAIAAYNPHRPRPKNLDGLRKNLRLRDGRWHWHWDPAFIGGTTTSTSDVTSGGIDGLPADRFTPTDRLEAAARRLRLPTLVVRGGSSDLLSEDGVRHLLELVPHAERVDVTGAGHMVAGDRNEVFNDAVMEFLDRTVPTE